jgi:arginase
MGLGPAHLLRAGLVDALVGDGHDVDTILVELSNAFRAELLAMFDLVALVERYAREARAQERRPIILSGNGFMSLGAIAALPQPASLLWLDAHADFNTPETTRSGFVDGTALATVTGRCWRELARDFPVVDDRQVVLAGARDLDAPEEKALASSGILRVAAADIARAMAPAMAGRSLGAAATHIHVDLDVARHRRGSSPSHAGSRATPWGAHFAQPPGRCTSAA